jgi:hypothetical protein
MFWMSVVPIKHFRENNDQLKPAEDRSFLCF